MAVRIDPNQMWIFSRCVSPGSITSFDFTGSFSVAMRCNHKSDDQDYYKCSKYDPPVKSSAATKLCTEYQRKD